MWKHVNYIVNKLNKILTQNKEQASTVLLRLLTVIVKSGSRIWQNSNVSHITLTGVTKKKTELFQLFCSILNSVHHKKPSHTHLMYREAYVYNNGHASFNSYSYTQLFCANNYYYYYYYKCMRCDSKYFQNLIICFNLRHFLSNMTDCQVSQDLPPSPIASLPQNHTELLDSILYKTNIQE